MLLATARSNLPSPLKSETTRLWGRRAGGKEGRRSKGAVAVAQQDGYIIGGAVGDREIEFVVPVEVGDDDCLRIGADCQTDGRFPHDQHSYLIGRGVGHDHIGDFISIQVARGEADGACGNNRILSCVEADRGSGQAHRENQNIETHVPYHAESITHSPSLSWVLDLDSIRDVRSATYISAVIFLVPKFAD